MSQDTIRPWPVDRLFPGKNFGFLATLTEDGSPGERTVILEITPEKVYYLKSG